MQDGSRGEVSPAAVVSSPMDRWSSDVAAFILAGGKSIRMGADKAFVTLDGQTLLTRALALARSATANVHIVGSATKFRDFAPVVEDIVPDCGPLGGIHAALRASAAELNLVLAVDLPFVQPTLLEFLIARARSSTCLATVPRSGKGFQPLCAVYRWEFGDLAENALRQGSYRIDMLFNPEQTQILAEDELRAGGFSQEMFRNLNTREDLAEAGAIPVTAELHRSFAAHTAAEDNKNLKS